MSPTTLRKRLNDEHPTWEMHYEDAATAAVELGLLDDIDVEAAYKVLDFEDEAANWERLERYYSEYNTSS